MSLRDQLQTRESIETVSKQSWRHGREDILHKGLAYYDAHPGDVERVRENLALMGLDASPEAVRRACEGIVVHYFEKIFVMVKDFEAHWVIENRVDVTDALEPLARAREARRAVFLAQSHFGGTYLLVPTLMTHGFDVTFVALFPPPVFELLRANIERYASRWSTGRVTLVNLADADATAPEIMMAALGAGEIVMNVFDENNALSRDVTMLGRRIRGGSGMDRILARFPPERVDVLAPFMVRTSDEAFRLEVDRHSLASGDVIQDLYGSLERRVAAHPEQWYFVQELHHSLGQPGG
jgi:lauroyl/myristoyl acyltransferase